jgi:TPR repeat protein
MASTALAVLAFLGASIGLDTLSPQELGLAELRRLGVSSREGIVATHVYSMSPADRAGLREGDVLLQLDGVALGTRDEMSAVLERHHPQDRVSLEYVRGSRRQAVEIVLESPAEMFVRACDARDPEGCYAAGNRFRYGRVVPRDSPKAAKYYEQGCSLDQWASCINLGRMLRDAEGVPREAARAVGFFQRACDAGVPEGCHHLGLQYLKGDGVSPDEARGRALIRSACEAGDADACSGLRQRPPTPPAPPPAA